MMGEEEGGVKLHRVRGDSGGVVHEEAHGEAVWQKYTADKGGK